MADDGETAPYAPYEEVARRVLGPRAPEVLNDAAWPALGATLSAAARGGNDPVTALASAWDQGINGDVRSVPALLSWRIRTELEARNAWPAAAAGRPVPATFNSAARPPRPEPRLTAVPSWQERPLGAVPSTQLAAEVVASRAEAVRAAVVARATREAATTASEVARSRRGPAVTALTARHNELGERVAAMDALAELDSEYRRVRDINGLGQQGEDVLRARLAVSERRLAERRWMGLAPAVRGQARQDLQDRTNQLRTYLEATGPRLTELDARRADLERRAGAERTRPAAYREWLETDRNIGVLTDTARRSDIAAADRTSGEATRLEGWAADRALRADALVTESATRASLPTERAQAENTARNAANAAAVQPPQAAEATGEAAAQAQESYAAAEEINEQEAARGASL
ncbi:hypothetical protein [Streptomyces celluloflavus]|uniref:hypothetical protein n=1 Tax=Streptomyces celluloflavus TaxID=58344 RepID=UPI003692D8AA